MDSIERRMTVLEREFSKHLQIEKNGREKMGKVIDTLATKADLSGFVKQSDFTAFQAMVATKEDVQAVATSVESVVSLIKNFKIGVHVGGTVFGFSGRFVVAFGGFLLAVAAITGILKGFLIWVHLSWLVNFFNSKS